MVPQAETNQVVWKPFHLKKMAFDKNQALKAVKPVVEMQTGHITEMALRLEFSEHEEELLQ
jgi:hypothetical protein